jgi:glyoxylase-like metal-dependent hydrolase (beta-lactamase superfamily II)
MKRLKHQIYYESDYTGATVGALLFSKDTVLVDAPLRPDEARAWLSELRKAGAKPRRLAINLDSHPDRTLGTQTLEAQVLAHRETARQFRRRAAIFKALKQESGAEWEETSGLSGLRWIMPRVTFSEHSVMFFDGRELRMEYHPGPGPGACWLVIPEDKIVFVGDAIVIGQPPFLAQADIEAWIEGLDLLLSRSFRGYTIISGRGGKATTQDVNAQKKMLDGIETTLKKISKKKSTANAEIDKLANRLLAKYKAPAKRRAFYLQRLKHGLHNYYARNYLPGSRSQNNH